MGVSGCGKTTIAKLLSLKTGIPFFDGDDFHPQENIDKMTQGIALQDVDRKPWLEHLNEKLKHWGKQKGAILACSALKENYRKILRTNVRIHWVFLEGDFDVIKNRMLHRNQHFMHTSLLQSQFDCLEVPAYGIKISIDQCPKNMVNEILINAIDD